ncbi:hypothetical protein [Amycolatopsis thailandensis]|uniref:hypothetical protein n=1 Tax=Amycolatopsis thailandensis TaxID=589330 RepID=UPI00362B96BE
MSAGAVTAQWWIYLLALIPASAAGRQVYRTISAERRWAMTRWLIGEARSRRRQAGTAELEDVDVRHRPLVVDSVIVEPRS